MYKGNMNLHEVADLIKRFLDKSLNIRWSGITSSIQVKKTGLSMHTENAVTNSTRLLVTQANLVPGSWPYLEQSQRHCTKPTSSRCRLNIVRSRYKVRRQIASKPEPNAAVAAISGVW
jgi:hypothetical protein